MAYLTIGADAFRSVQRSAGVKYDLIVTNPPYVDAGR